MMGCLRTRGRAELMTYQNITEALTCHMFASCNVEVLCGLITWCSLSGGLITHSRCTVVFHFNAALA